MYLLSAGQEYSGVIDYVKQFFQRILDLIIDTILEGSITMLKNAFKECNKGLNSAGVG